MGSGDHSHMLGAGRSRAPGRGGPLAQSWHGVGGAHNQHGGPPRHLQLVDRASSPLTLLPDGSLPPGEVLCWVE